MRTLAYICGIACRLRYIDFHGTGAGRRYFGLQLSTTLLFLLQWHYSMIMIHGPETSSIWTLLFLPMGLLSFQLRAIIPRHVVRDAAECFMDPVGIASNANVFGDASIFAHRIREFIFLQSMPTSNQAHEMRLRGFGRQWIFFLMLC